MTNWERITADQAVPGDDIALPRNSPPMKVLGIESIGATSRYIAVRGDIGGKGRIRARDTTKVWRVVR